MTNGRSGAMVWTDETQPARKVARQPAVATRRVDSTYSGGAPHASVTHAPAHVRAQTVRTPAAQRVGLPRRDSFELGELAQARRALAAGRAFGVSATEKIERIAGTSISRDGLVRLYAPSLPQARAFLQDVCLEERSLDFLIRWADPNGRVVAQVGRVLHRHPDGSLELHGKEVWVDPRYRGRGFTLQVMHRELDLMRLLTSHLPGRARDRSRLSLRAGGMFDVNPDAPKEYERVGLYAWAKLGYDFADKHAAVPRLEDYGPRLPNAVDEVSVPSLELHRACFRAWLERQLIAGALSLTPKERGEVERAVEAWQYPWDIAAVDVKGKRVDISIAGELRACPIGKAYLVSGAAPFWDGVFFVHQADAPGMRLFQSLVQRDARRAANG